MKHYAVLILMIYLRSVIKRQTTQTTSDYEWLQVTTSDCKWLWARLRGTKSDYKQPQVTTSDYKPDYEWLRVTISDYDCESSYEWLQLRLAITLGIKTFIVSYDYIDSCATFLAKFIAKYLRCRGSRSQMFFKVSVLKNFANFTGKHLC